jgi:hypothetical protein
MLRSSKLLPVLALVTALAPMAANAAPFLNHQDPVIPSGATIDDPTTACSYGHSPFLMQPAPAKYNVAPLHHAPMRPSGATIDNPTSIYSGGQAPMFPVSEGG